jgi:hypothetical protein
MPRGLRFIMTLCVIAPVLIGCTAAGGTPTGSTAGSHSPSDGIASVPPSSASGRTLLTWLGQLGPTMEALVLGPTAINEAGCVTLGGRVLVAPPGSTIDSSGTRLHIESVGDFGLGDPVEASGGYLSASELGPTPPAGYATCLNEEFVIVGGPRS